MQTVIRTSSLLMSCFIAVLFLVLFSSCRLSRKIHRTMQPRESVAAPLNLTQADSIQTVVRSYDSLLALKKTFNTFQAKAKIESTGADGKNPDVTAVIKIVEDSAIWVSLTATILNVEVYRILITKDSVVLMNKRDKEVQYRPIAYLQDLIQAPFDYQTLEALIVGNPVFISDSIVHFGKANDITSMTMLSASFKHFIMWNHEQHQLLQSKLDDVDLARNRTIYMQYDKHENRNGFMFSKERRIFASEKKKLEVYIEYKSFEMGIPLTISFNVPRNYTKK